MFIECLYINTRIYIFRYKNKNKCWAENFLTEKLYLVNIFKKERINLQLSNSIPNICTVFQKGTHRIVSFEIYFCILVKYHALTFFLGKNKAWINELILKYIKWFSYNS